jgi:hypothetical protein
MLTPQAEEHTAGAGAGAGAGAAVCVHSEF